jgi:hypothetical protein
MIAAPLLRWAQARYPDVEIGGHERPYLRRWWRIPRNAITNAYVHLFLRSDDDRALHDHPWLFNLSILLAGSYLEHTPEGVFLRKAGQWKFRWGRAPHRVELLTDPETGEPIPCWTLFITGPRVRDWGFYCPQGWVFWEKFTSSDGNDIGRGCDQ